MTFRFEYTTKTWLESKENSINDDLGKKEVNSRGHFARSFAEG